MPKTVPVPRADMAAVRAGDQDALIVALLALASGWMRSNSLGLSFPVSASELAARGDTSKAGMLAAAVDLRSLMSQCPQGRKALRDFGFEPLFEYVEGE